MDPKEIKKWKFAMTMDDIELVRKSTKYSKKEKEEFLGKGPWTTEPDCIEFKYKDYKCEIRRMFTFSSGGYLCGYVVLDEDHPFYRKDLSNNLDIPLDCHGGVTYSNFDYNNIFRIGFDCAHHGDLIPSLEKIKISETDYLNTRNMFKKLFKSLGEDEFDRILRFKSTYKDVNFCIEECKNLVNSIEKHVKKGNENNE